MLLYVVVFIVLFFYFLVFYSFIITLYLPVVANKRVHYTVLHGTCYFYIYFHLRRSQREYFFASHPVPITAELVNTMMLLYFWL